MARAHLYRPVQDAEGDLVTDLTVRLLEPGTDAEISATIYVDRDGDEVLTQPISVPSGIIDLYLPYPKVVRLAIFAAGEETFFDDVPVGFPYEHEIFWSIAGDASVMTGLQRFYVEHDTMLLSARVSAGVPPTGTPLICDVNVNDESVFAAPGDRPTLAEGENTVLTTFSEGILIPAEDYLTFDVDQVGAIDPGSHIVVQLRLARA